MTTALITGASSGIGEAFARRLAGAGRDLFLVARSEDKLRSLCKELAEEHGIRADHAAIDLSVQGSDKELYEATESREIEVDLLINNAGFGSMGDFAEMELQRELEMIRLNIIALVALTHRYLAGMRKRRSGTIINVSSAASFQPVPFFSTYAATKAFVTSFSEAIAEESRPFGIQVLALCPGSTSTNFFDASKIERALQIKGQQTADQVVDTALAALNGRRTKIVSGWSNYAVSVATNFIPNFLITRVVGRGLRSRYQKDL